MLVTSSQVLLIISRLESTAINEGNATFELAASENKDVKFF